MKRFKQPAPDSFDQKESLITRIESEYGKIELLCTAELSAKKETTLGDLRTISVDLYRSTKDSDITAYFVLSRNRSLDTAHLLFRSVLNTEEQENFDSLMNEYKYNEAALYLSENTF